MNPIKILILTANPHQSGQDYLRVDSEVKLVEEALRRSNHRDQFQLFSKLAVSTRDLRRALLDYHPQIVHFSGHGVGQLGLVLETDEGEAETVSTEAISQLFGAFESGSIECVILNACYSDVQARAIHEFVDCVIGMNQPIGDRAAIDFSEGFYDALGSGSHYDEAFKLGKNAIAASGSPEDLTPVLKHRKRPGTIPPALQSKSASDVSSANGTAVQAAAPGQSQSFGNISIGGSNNPFNAINSTGSVTIDQSQTHTVASANPSVQAAIDSLNALNQAIAAETSLDSTTKEMLSVPLRNMKAELHKPKPDKTAIAAALAPMKMFLASAAGCAAQLTNLSEAIVAI